MQERTPPIPRELWEQIPATVQVVLWDEVFLTIKGEHRYLWRAINQEGNVLDYLGAASKRQAGSQEVLPQIAQGVGLRAARHHHR
jgi:transposase-like protein